MAGVDTQNMVVAHIPKRII